MSPQKVEVSNFKSTFQNECQPMWGYITSSWTAETRKHTSFWTRLYPHPFKINKLYQTDFVQLLFLACSFTHEWVESRSKKCWPIAAECSCREISTQGEGALPLVQLSDSFAISCFKTHDFYCLFFQQRSLKLIAVVHLSRVYRFSWSKTQPNYLIFNLGNMTLMQLSLSLVV